MTLKLLLFNYRTYSNAALPNNLFCNDVPTSEINITKDEESTCTADYQYGFN